MYITWVWLALIIETLYIFFQDNTFQGGFPESQVNSILDAWNAVVTHDFRDAEYKSLWSEIYSLTANFARCPQHASLWG